MMNAASSCSMKSYTVAMPGWFSAVQPRVMSTEYNAHAAAAEFGFNSVAVGYEIAQHGWRPGPAQLYTNRCSVEEPGGLAFSCLRLRASPTISPKRVGF